MLSLRVTQFSEGEDKYRVEVALEGDGMARQAATARFGFKLSAEDQEGLRWYLEDYLQNPHDPAPAIAARIEARMAEIGAQLFGAVFQADDDARDLWAKLRERLNDTRVEIVTGVREATAIPWELISDPKTGVPLALRARAFVRAQPQAAQAPQLPHADSGPIRILLVICRPRGDEDVPFRSVASRLVKGLSEDARAVFRLDVLRPPTFGRLGEVLRKAKADGKPYHIAHFDGHGTYQDVSPPGVLSEIRKKLSRLVLSGPRAGTHGYLLFENPNIEENMQLVDGPALGGLLAETGVPVLVLNACRSAHAEAANEPRSVASLPAEAAGRNAYHTEADVHTQVRAFGSLAQEVMDAGVAGIVAMRYNVYVATAAQFVADLYAALAQGHTLGEAVTLGRKQLHDDPLRAIAYDPLPLQDWPVPAVYEAAPIPLFPKPAEAEKLTIKLAEERGQAGLDPKLPARPDAGFFGRDETLLALDRAFDTQRIVLLHAYAGSGKTATAAEFARWYSLTGGVEGPVLFTSFEHHTPLARVLDEIERVFGKSLERVGVNWLAIENPEKRREVALQVLKQVPVLWIWDNVEPVAGFPAGAESGWSKAEQQELAGFLREARETQAKFLLTSRRDERAWLGEELPARVTLRPMPMLERVQLARALAEKRGRRLTDVDDWRPLLAFTQGNPLAITVLVGQALRDGLKTKEQIEDFVGRLRAGEPAFEDEASEGRAKSLGAALSYGFEHAFSEPQRKQLALVHLFQGFVDVDALRSMGNPDADYCLPEVRGLTREAGINLLDRAAEIGLLIALGRGYYTIHPALPWYFKGLFEQHCAGAGVAATRTFVEVMGQLGEYYLAQYEGGDRDVIAALTAEEANLLHARELARRHGWWDAVTSTMQGLRALYDQTGRRVEWKRLVEEIVPQFVDPTTDGRLPGREDDWSLVTEYRVKLAMEARYWAEAERLQRIRVDWNRRRAAAALATPKEKLDAQARNEIRNLSVALSQLGQILRERGGAQCVAVLEEAHSLSLRINDGAGAAVKAFNLGRAYVVLPNLRNLTEAERWYRRSLELHDERDRLGRGKCLGELGLVAYERFEDARAAEQPEQALRYLQEAAQFYEQALGLTPPDAVADLAVGHNQLGNIYADAGNVDRALQHFRESIRCHEASSDPYGAAQARFNVALLLADAGRFTDAREYAYAALRNYETFGDRASKDIDNARRLIARIEQDMKPKGTSA